MVNILQVQENDSAEAVRRLLTQARDERVALLLPDGWAELDNMARMRLLQRQAQRRRMHVALITRHDATRKAASQVGVPVFYEASEAARGGWTMTPWLPLPRRGNLNQVLPESPHWRQAEVVQRLSGPHKRQVRQNRIEAAERFRRPLPAWLSWLGTGLMGAMIVLLLAGFAFYVLPAATVTLAPGRQALAVSVQLTGDPALDAPDLRDNRLPARLIELNIEETGTARTTGTRQVASGKARGTVTFQNLSSAGVRVPRGTIVSTSGGRRAQFTTLNDVELGGVNARADVAVEALEEGIDGNVLVNRISVVEGPLRVQVRVFNSSGTFGGGAQAAAVVTQEDLDTLRAEVGRLAEERAFDTLQAQLEPGEWLSRNSIRTIVTGFVPEQFVDEEAETLTVTVRVLAQGIAVSDEESTAAALETLSDEIPDQGRLVANSVTYRREPGTEFVGNTVVYTMTAAAEYVIPINPVDVRDAIAGLTPAEAASVLQNRWPLVRPPEIYRDPELLSTLPAIGSRIQVRIAYE